MAYFCDYGALLCFHIAMLTVPLETQRLFFINYVSTIIRRQNYLVIFPFIKDIVTVKWLYIDL